MAVEALLPPLLPTPPKSEMLQLLPTPHGVILTMLVSAMPGRADFVKRWDWNKKRQDPCSSTSSSSSSSSEASGSACRADSVDRWDSHKKYKTARTTTTMSSSSSSSSHGAGSPGRADSVERWDSKKLETSPPTESDRGRYVGNNKRLPSPSRASSAERWDLHKKPRPEPEQMEKPPQTTNAAATTLALATTTPHKAAFAGHSFYAAPEPSMLPIPSLFLLALPRALCISY